MRKVKFLMTNLIKIEVDCRNSDTPNLLNEFYDFVRENEIDEIRGGSGEHGYFIGYFNHDNAEKVKKWFLEKGVITK